MRMPYISLKVHIPIILLIYQIYRLVRGSGAVRILVGLALIYLVYLVVRAAGNRAGPSGGRSSRRAIG